MCTPGYGGGSVLLAHFLALLANNGGGGRVVPLCSKGRFHVGPGVPDAVEEHKLKKCRAVLCFCGKGEVG